MGRLLQTLLSVVLLTGFVSIAAASTLPVPEGYISVERGHCTFLLPPVNAGVADLLGEVCQERLKNIYKQLGVPLGYESPTSIEVRIVAAQQEMKLVAPPNYPPPKWASAVAYPDMNLIILPLRTRMGGPAKDLDIIFEHEISHLALRKALHGAKVPRWFSEGIAISQSEHSSFRRHMVLWRAAQSDSLLPLASIENYPDHSGEINVAYAQAADFVGYILRQRGWYAIRNTIDHMAKGEQAGQKILFRDAFEYGFNSSLGSLEAGWRQGLTQSWAWKWIPLLTGSGMLWGSIVVLFLLAYRNTRRRHRQQLLQMEREEASIDRMLALEKMMVQPQDHSSITKTTIRVEDEIHTLH